MKAHVWFFAACALVPIATVIASNGGKDDDGFSNDDGNSDDGWSGDDGSSDDDASHSKVVTALLRSPGSPDSDATGKIELEKEVDSDGVEQELEIEAEHLPFGHTFFVHMEDAKGSANFVSIAAMDDGYGFAFGPGGDDSCGDDDSDEDDSEVKAKWKLEDGAGGLPFGATDLEQLAGRAIEIRDEANVAYLYGTVPSLLGNLKPTHGKVKLEAPGKPKGLLRMKCVPKQAKDEFDLAVSGLKGLPGVVVVLEDPKTHALCTVVTLPLKANGTGKLRLQTKKGDTLPFGTTTVKALSGLAFQVRSATNSSLIFSGKLPKL